MVSFDLLDARDFAEWPTTGNANETEFGGVRFNLTTLQHWNYTYFTNGTLSNGSRCYLTYPPYQPVLLRTNGSFINATSCYSAVDPIAVRGFAGIGLAVAYGIALVLIITVLAKHGKMYLPEGKRFYPIGRRWQWYWGSFVCACALISLFINVDVDRYHIQELPIIVMCFFWFLLCQGTTALVWEAVRHWGSWQERQYIDPNPFVLREDDKRAKLEFWLPMWFYLWLWLNFFLVVPRSWNFLKMQRDPYQIQNIAIPTATSARFKAAGFCLVICWLTICFSLRHSIRHYKPRNRGVFNRAVGFLQSLPLRFVLIIPLSAALIAYQIFMSFEWELSLLRFQGVVPVQFGWGFGPSLLILIIQIIYGFTNPNEDKELIRQRRERGEGIDRELGIVKKPAWWRRVRGDHLEVPFHERVMRNVKEVGGKRGIGRRAEADMERHMREEAERYAVNEDGIELSSMTRRDSNNPRVDRAGARNIGSGPSSSQPAASRYEGKSERRHHERIMQSAAGMLFPNSLEADRARRHAELSEDGPPPAYTDAERERGRQGSNRPESANRNNSTSTTNSLSAPPQQVRSMLDI